MTFHLRSVQMTKQEKFTASLLVFAATLSIGSPVRAECGEVTLVEVVHQALDANQALAAAGHTLDAQEKEVAIKRAGMLPRLNGAGSGVISSGATFSATAGVIPEKTTQAAGVIQQTLYDQSKIDALGSQKHLFRSQQSDYESARADTIAGAGQDYVGLLLSEALLEVQEQNLSLTQESLEITKSQEEAGAVLYRDVLRWQAQVYADQQKVVTQKSSVLTSRFALNQTRNRPSEEVCSLRDLDVESAGFVFSSPVVAEALTDPHRAALLRDYLVDLGIERSPTITSLDAQLRYQERIAKSARRWLIPSLEATAGGAIFLKTGGGGSDVQSSGDTFWQAQGVLSWSILDGGAYISTMNLEKAQLHALQAERTDTATAIEEQVRAAAAVAIASFENIGLSGLQSETANQNYELVNEAYLEGAATFLELLDSQQQRVNAERAARQALYGFLSDLLAVEQSVNYFPFMESDAEARVRELEKRLGQR